ncbi:class II aldolase/adducin family protein [soil metagenome]
MTRTSAAETALRARIVAAARGMNARGINAGASGNVSARWGAGLLVTPSGMDYAAMAPGDIVAMRADGTASGGRPSSEWRFHRDILAARPEIGAVLHCHAVHATALACHGRGMPAFQYMVALAGGQDIRCAPYATFGTQALSDAVLGALEGRRACLMAHHGMVVLGASPEAALALAVEVETLARMYLAAHALGSPPVRGPGEMARVSEAMAARGYGPAPGA